jgi:uncharacterized protein (DUF433 family)
MVAEIKTEHPHIVIVEGAAGRKAVIAGTLISVFFIVRQLATGDTPEDIVGSLPHLTLAGVYDAISYYHDHRDEIDELIAEATPEAQAAKHGFTIEGRKIKFRDR